jgi:hypothetical protein
VVGKHIFQKRWYIQQFVNYTYEMLPSELAVSLFGHVNLEGWVE